MKTKVKYNTANANGWRIKADDLFLAQFRGRPCEICGNTRGWDGKMIRSCGHHLAEKGMHRAHRYNKRLIVILCPEHHSRFSRGISPHADDTVAVTRFYSWLQENKPEQHQELLETKEEPFDGSWTYKEMYERLGGEITSPTGLIKDEKPLNHAQKIRAAESND
jgi:hypothetical protein